MQMTPILPAALAAALLALAAPAQEPADLLEYVVEIRKAGMTGAARGDLEMVAAIRTGETLLRFVEGEKPGEYGRSYMGTSCALPGADQGRVAQLQAALRKKTEEDLEALKAYADADGSGFVSTEEAAGFRDLIEFGYLGAFVIREKGPSLERIAKAACLTPEEAGEKLDRYNALAERLNAGTSRRMPVLRIETTDPAARSGN
jgi:hypothetical protein